MDVGTIPQAGNKIVNFRMVGMSKECLRIRMEMTV